MPLSGNQTTGSTTNEEYTYDPSAQQLIYHIFTNGRASIANAQYPIFTKNYVAAFNGLINNNGPYYSFDVSAVKIPADTSANRPTLTGSTYQGIIRYNTTSGFPEFYNGTNWMNMVYTQLPSLTSISPTIATQASQTITLNGTTFDQNPTVSFIDTSNNITYNSPTVIYINSTQVTATTPSPNGLPIVAIPYSVKITNANGLSSTLSNALSSGAAPVFITPAGSIGNIYNLSSTNGLYSLLPVTAIDPDGDPITYSISAGALPSGLSINSSTGAITGNAASVGSTTTYTFTVSAITANATATRQFSITVYQQQVQAFQFTVAPVTQWPVPKNVVNIRAKLWGAGAGAYNAGIYSNPWTNGGAGGYTETSFNIIPADASYITVVVGGGNTYSSPSQYGGGGGGVNGACAGGGMSAIFGKNLTNPFIIASSSPFGSYSNPQSNITTLNQTSGIIAIAGGGGGAGWYPSGNYPNGGNGGGINGTPATTGNAQPTAGTQSAGGSAAGSTYAQSGALLTGGYVFNNASSGGSGGGGGGYYGGGAWQTSTSGYNAGGGGGSGFVGFANGSSSTVLTATSGNSYTDSITRTNPFADGTRSYANSQCLAQTAGTFTALNTSDADYITYSTPSSNVGSTYKAATGSGTNNSVNANFNDGGNGLVVIRY